MSNSRKNVGGGGGLNHNHNNANNNNNNNNNNGKMKKPAAAVNNSQQQDKDTNGLTNGGHDEDAGDLKSVVERQSELIRQQREDLEEMKRKLEANVRISDDFRAEISEIRKNVQNDEKVERLTSAVNDIQDRLYEIDKSWKNNLVLYGIPQSADSLDEDPFILEEKVREVFHKKLHISREIAISRVSRMLHGPDFRGHKPIQICIVNYRDKEEILRKARLLKGSNIYISEDFSRKVREHRHELIKFMKEIRSRDPSRRMTLRYDKLYMGNHDIFFFNDRTARVEKLHQNAASSAVSSVASAANAVLGSILVNESQEAAWLRSGVRPRSRQRSSRSATPLSRQNSVSVDDFRTVVQDDDSRMVQRGVASARLRRPKPKTLQPLNISNNHHHHQPLVKKAASIDSLDYDSDGGGMALVPYARGTGEGSSTPSPTKHVAFKDIPPLDRETPRMLNGTPHHNPFPRAESEDFAALEDESLMVVNTGGNHYEIQQPAPATTTVLPPIDYLTPKLLPAMRANYIMANGGEQQQQQQQQLPQILHSSLGKLQMNFVQQNGIVAKSDGIESGIANPTTTLAKRGNTEVVESDRVNRAKEQIANGVLKVAMYGEFPVPLANGSGNGNGDNAIKSNSGGEITEDNHVAIIDSTN